MLPRDMLMKFLYSRLPHMLVTLTKLALQPITIQRRGDEKMIQQEIEMGVSQGSLLIRTVFNIYMDSLSEALKRDMTLFCSNPIEPPAYECTLIADNVRLQAANSVFLKTFLVTAKRWAGTKEVSLFPQKRFVVKPQKNVFRENYTFCQTILEKKPEVDYLSVTISAIRTSKSSSMACIRRAHNKLQILRFACQCRLHVPVSIVVYICICLIFSIVEYDLHLIPHSDQLIKA